jgi:uncharacterized protein with GYD domain
MEKFFVLMRLTAKGTAELGAVAGSLEMVRVRLVDGGFIGPETAIHVVVGGPSDFVADCAANEFDDAAYFAAELAMTGLVQTTTQKAYSLDYFQQNIVHRKMAP